MSEILINCMAMPKDGFITITVTSDGRVVGNSKKESGKFEYLDNEDIAKAIPVPPHGRLIDADECHKYFYDHLDDTHMKIAEIAIEEMPTIIPANSEEEEMK